MSTASKKQVKRRNIFVGTKGISYPETPEVAHTLRVMQRTMKSIEGRSFEEKMAFINNISITPSRSKTIVL
ncbi:MAG: hypothetical protein E7037_02360 [Verrucomicrobia bacterium]|nr:hypothetical protein [Verrucomicrobiota bacterium]